LLQMEAPDLAACHELHLRLAQKPWNRG
jgi:hypothetical protein